LPAQWRPLRPVCKTTFGAQVIDWLGFVAGQLTNPWAWDRELFADSSKSYYGAHLWTIQTEFHCSMILFLVAMALSRLSSSRARTMLWAGCTGYCVLWGRWDVTLFLCGTAFADIDVQSSIAKLEDPGKRSYPPYLATVGHMAALLTGLWLASYPEKRGSEALGFRLISAISQSQQMWQSFGAISIVWSVRRVLLVQTLLATSLFQYLGRVSFALYIVHEPLVQTFGWIYAKNVRLYFMLAGEELGLGKEVSSQIGVCVALFSLTPVVIVVADYVWRGLDKPTIALTREIGKCI
jgi:peptidoglycan/LPS O-acetylase OafA/YrhL